LNLSVTTLTVKSGGLINLSLAGWRGSEGIGKGTDSSSYGGGGAYGGIGGNSNSDAAGGSVYGNVSNVTTKGSGGGSGFSGDQGGHGAAFLKVNAVNYINITGKIEANGGSGHGGGSGDGYGGGGSGGGIYLATNYLQGSGNIHAEGGKGCCGGGGTYSGGGGGGRIYVEYCDNSSSSIDFNVTRGYSDPTKTMSTSGTINQTYIATLCPAPNGVPIISESSFYRANIWTTQNVNMSVKCLDNESVNLELNFTWFKNNVLVYTRNVTALNDTVYARGLNYNNYTFGDLINVTVDCWDGADRSSSIMDSTTVAENEPPVPSIISPANNNLSAQSVNYFNCSATDNINLSTIQLYSNFTGTWGLNKTNVTTGLANSITFPVNISDGLYKWTCKANDTSNNINWANENRSIEVDTHAPNFNISYPLTNDLWFSSASININITYGYDRNLANCNYSMGTDNGAFTCGNNISLIGLTDGQHNLSISISDTLGHYNNSLRSFYTDTNAPVPTAIEPVNDSKSLVTEINFNCSATDNINIDSIMTYGNWSGWGLKLLNHTSGTINSTYNNIQTNPALTETYFRWYCCANDTAGNIGCTGNSTINIDTRNPAISITTMPSDNLTFNDTSLVINFTYVDGHAGTCKRSLDGQPNVTISCFNNVTDLSGLSEGNHTIQVYGNDTFSRNTTEIREFLINTIQSIVPSYVNPAFEYDTIYFTLNVTAPSITSFNGTFTYNHTLYYPTVIYNSIRGTLISQINITDLNIDYDTRYFEWNFSMNGYNKYNASTYSHVVKKIPALYTNVSCISDLQRAMCWDFKEENNLTQTNADEINYNFQYGVMNTTHTKNYGTLTNLSSFCLCINSTVYNNYTMGFGEIKYKKSGYTDRSFYTFTTQRLSNDTINNTLYFLTSGTATSFLFEMLDTSLNPYPNDYLSLMRWYPSNNSYNIVEMARTDDKGQSVMRVRAEDTDYRVALYYPNGTIIKLLNPIRFACLASPCTYSVQIQETPLDYTSIFGVETSLTFNKTTNMWLFTWNDPTQRTDQMEFKVSKETALSSTLICDKNATGFTGVLDCNSTGINGTLRGIAYRTASPKETIAQLWQNVVGAVVTIQNAFKGTMGLLFTLLICITLFFIGASSPILAVILGAVSLVFGLFTLSISLNVLIGIAVLGGIVVHFISRTSS